MPEEKRLRVFAGPNGSGKSTVINFIRHTKVGSRNLDFGVYINADELAKLLLADGVSLKSYSVDISRAKIIKYAVQSGLLIKPFTPKVFNKSFVITRKGFVVLRNRDYAERFAQLLALVLREELLLSGKKLSIETVFSHSGKVDFMRRAKEAGYKVYLYFVATESPELNKYRVRLRVHQGGHDVPDDKIESRYFRSLELMRPALEQCYRAYFFDNSVTLGEIQDGYFAQASQNSRGVEWIRHSERIPNWFTQCFGDCFEEGK